MYGFHTKNCGKTKLDCPATKLTAPCRTELTSIWHAAGTQYVRLLAYVVSMLFIPTKVARATLFCDAKAAKDIFAVDAVMYRVQALVPFRLRYDGGV